MWRSSIWPITARFNTSWLESHSWSSRGQFRPFLISSSIQVRQKVCPHLMEMTGSMKTFLQTGHSKADGSSTNLVGLPGISFSWYTRFSFRAFSTRQKNSSSVELGSQIVSGDGCSFQMGHTLKLSWCALFRVHCGMIRIYWIMDSTCVVARACMETVCDREQMNTCHRSHQWLSRVPKATLICLRLGSQVDGNIKKNKKNRIWRKK